MTLAVNIAQSGSNNQTFRNRIINGAMVIDQRNNGASINLSNTPAYLVDRWQTRLGTSSGSTAARSTTAPAGFTNSVLLTIGTGASPSASTGSNYFNQILEGFNCADLGWGTANAQPVTLSFWVRSSLTGTFGICVGNDALTRTYPTSYTISAANTWEYKTISIPATTSGTFSTDNTGSVRVIFDWGNGSDYKGPANTWANADYRGGASGTTNICATSGATWFITGVQLEEGTAASPFEFRQYGTELALCQRYYARSTAVVGYANTTSSIQGMATFLVQMRATPTITNTGTVRITDGAVNSTSTASPSSTFGTATGCAFNMGSFTANLTAYRPFVQDGSGGDSFAFSAEL